MAELTNVLLDSHLDFLLKDLNENIDSDDVQCSQSSLPNYKIDCDETSVNLCSNQSNEYPLTQSNVVNKLPHLDESNVSTPFIDSSPLSTHKETFEKKCAIDLGLFDSNLNDDHEKLAFTNDTHWNNSTQSFSSEKQQTECSSQPTNPKDIEEISISSSWPKYEKNKVGLADRLTKSKNPNYSLIPQFLHTGNEPLNSCSQIQTSPDQTKPEHVSKSSSGKHFILGDKTRNFDAPPVFSSPEILSNRINNNVSTCIEKYPIKLESYTMPCLFISTNCCSSGAKSSTISPTVPHDVDISKEYEVKSYQNCKMEREYLNIQKQELQNSPFIKPQNKPPSSLEQEDRSNIQEDLSITQNVPYPSIIERKFIQPGNEIQQQQIFTTEPLHQCAEEIIQPSDVYKYQESPEKLVIEANMTSCKAHKQAVQPVIQKFQLYSDSQIHEAHVSSSDFKQNMHQGKGMNQTDLQVSEVLSEPGICYQHFQDIPPLDKDLNNDNDRETGFNRHHQKEAKSQAFKEKFETHNDNVWNAEPRYEFGQESFQSSGAHIESQQVSQISKIPTDLHQTEQFQLNSSNYLGFSKLLVTIDQKQKNLQETHIQEQDNLAITQLPPDKIISNSNQPPQANLNRAKSLESVTVAKLQSDCQLKRKFEEEPGAKTGQELFQPSNKCELGLISQEEQRSLQNSEKPPNLPVIESTQLVQPECQGFPESPDIITQTQEQSFDFIEQTRPLEKQTHMQIHQFPLQLTNTLSNQSNHKSHISFEGQRRTEYYELKEPENVIVHPQSDAEPLYFEKSNEIKNTKSILPVSEKDFLYLDVCKQEKCILNTDQEEEECPQRVQKPAAIEKSQASSPICHKSLQLPVTQKLLSSIVNQQEERSEETDVQNQEDSQAAQTLGEQNSSCCQEYLYTLNLQIQEQSSMSNYHELKISEEAINEMDELATHSNDKPYKPSISKQTLQDLSTHKTIMDTNYYPQSHGQVQDSGKEFELTKNQSDQEAPQNCLNKDQEPINRKTEKRLKSNQQEKEINLNVDNLLNSPTGLDLSSIKMTKGTDPNHKENAILSSREGQFVYAPTSRKLHTSVEDAKKRNCSFPYGNASVGSRFQTTSIESLSKEAPQKSGPSNVQVHENLSLTSSIDNSLDLQIVPCDNAASDPQEPKNILQSKVVEVAVNENLHDLPISEDSYCDHETHEMRREIKTDNVLEVPVSTPHLKIGTGTFTKDLHFTQEGMQPTRIESIVQESQQLTLTQPKNLAHKSCDVGVEVYVCSRETQLPLHMHQSHNNGIFSKLPHHLQPSSLATPSTNQENYLRNSLSIMPRQNAPQMLHMQLKEKFDYHSLEPRVTDDHIFTNSNPPLTEVRVMKGLTKSLECSDTTHHLKRVKMEDQTIQNLPQDESPHINAHNDHAQVYGQDNSIGEFKQNTSADHGQHKEVQQSEDHMVPENSISTDAEWKDVSLYGEAQKADKHLQDATRKRSFQWSNVYEATLLQSSNNVDMESQPPLELGLLHSQHQTQRPLRLGLSKRQKVKSLHDK